MGAPRTLADLPPRAALAVGAFDGLHLGHQAILLAMRRHANAHGLPPAILSFERLPAAALDPGRAPGRIQDLDAFNEACRPYAPGGPLLLPFSPELANLSAEDFARRLQGFTLFCGQDWRFGRGAQGTPALLQSLGIPVHIQPDALWRSRRIASTRIRAALLEGRLDDAAAMLGRPWSFTGAVAHGRHLAATALGLPTLNLPYAGRRGETLAPLARGVYRALAALPDGSRHPALVNFGTAPTLKDEAVPLLEAHLPGFSGDLYGQTVTLFFDAPMLRPERRFPSLNALKAQLHADLAAL